MRKYGGVRSFLLGLAACAGLAGCAGMQQHESKPGLHLPSPWSTLKSSKRTATSSQAATSASAATSKKHAGTSATDEAIAMELLRGRNLERSGDWENARQLYEGLREKHPDSVDVVHRLGVVADNQRRHEEAEQLFLVGLTQEPRNGALLADLGYCYFLQGQLTKAESALRKATAYDPSELRHWNNLGLVIGHQGRHEEALACFRKAGSEADALYNLAFVLAAQDRADDAKQCFQRALAADPTHRRSREALASFAEYEQLPEHVRDVDMLADGGVRYVPYIEGSGNSSVAAASAEGPIANSREASQVARALQMQSRGMLNRNMQSQRSEEPVQ